MEAEKPPSVVSYATTVQGTPTIASSNKVSPKTKAIDAAMVQYLFGLLDSPLPGIRQGAYKELTKHLQATTSLSKTDVKSVAKELVPSANQQTRQNTVEPTAHKQKTQKRAAKEQDPRILKLKQSFEGQDTGDGSAYQTQIRVLRTAIKAEKK